MKITGITRDKHVRERFHVKVDGREPFPVSAQTIVKYGLSAGAEFEEERFGALLKDDENSRAMDASLNLLSFSQRSRKELSERLRQKGFSQAAIDHALARLTELKYIDDAVFARNLLNLRRSQGKGTELIRFELKRKGIAGEVINAALSENTLAPQEEAEAILPLARKKLAQMRALPDETAARRLLGFLARRGFSPDTSRAVLRLLKKKPVEDES